MARLKAYHCVVFIVKEFVMDSLSTCIE